MAVIGSIRKHSTILLIVVAIALVAFLLGDFLSNRGGVPKYYDKMITVEGEYISLPDFQMAYDIRRQMAKDNNQGTELQGEQDFQLGNQLYTELVDSLLIGKQAHYLGIVVTVEEISDLIVSDMPHQWAQSWFNVDGTGYNMEVARRFVNELSSYPDTNTVKYYLMVESQIAKEAFQQKYFNLLSSAYYLPKAFAKKMADEQQTKADVEVVQIAYSSELASDDKISFTEDDVKKWYEENKYRFEQEEEMRDVDYVIFDIQPSAVDLDNIAKSIETAYTEFLQTDQPGLFVNRMSDARYDNNVYFKRGELPVPALDTIVFNAPVGTFIPPFIDGNNWVFAKLLDVKERPDSIRIRSISISERGTEQQPRKKEESTARLDSAYNLLKNGADFYQTALQFSDDPVDQMPDSGTIWLPDASGITVYQKWFDTLYSLPIGSIIKQNVNGVNFIFKLSERSPFSKKVQIAIAKKAIDASSETIGNIESAANNFANGLATVQDFEEKVTKEGLNKRNFNRVQIMSYNLPGINGNGREIVRWIYDEKTQKGDVSKVYSMENMYVVVTLKEIYLKGYTSLANEQLKNYVESMVKRDKKAEMLEGLLKPSVGKSLTEIAEQFTSRVDTTQVVFGNRNFAHYGPESKMLGEIFAKQANQTNTIYQGDMGVYVLKVNKIDVPDMAFNEQDNAAIEAITQQGKESFVRGVQNSTVQALRKMYKIEDNRYKFF